MAYSGSCHCGAVSFRVDGDEPTEAISCNCSHCQRKGFLLSFVPASTFTLESGEDALQSYFFNKHSIEHLFCKTCGTEAFAQAEMPGGQAMKAINLRCVPSIDLASLTLQQIDGASR